MVDTSDEWIRSRTGIGERRIAARNETTSDMATKAAQSAPAETLGITPDEIDLIIVATVTPDMFFPATACFVQAKIGAKRAACFDVSAACSGFLYAVEIAQQFITSNTYNTILVIGAEKLSCIVDWTDRNTLRALRRRGRSRHSALPRRLARRHHHAYVEAMRQLCRYSQYSRRRLEASAGGTNDAGERLHAIKMNGKETYKQAVTAMMTAATAALESANLKISDLACIIPHQANMRIIEAIAERMELPIEKFMVNLDRYGNTSAARGRDRIGRSQPQRTDEGRRLYLVSRLWRWADLGQLGDSVVRNSWLVNGNHDNARIRQTP